MIITEKLSPNCNDRKNCTSPEYIILHYTGATASESKDVYMDSSSKLSPHYMIDVDGDVTQFVNDDKRAWHAGKSYKDGCDDINSRSIGIEIVNGGHGGGLPEFPADQINSVISICKEISERHSIFPINILGHSDVAIGRKLDPGEMFPWEYLSQQEVGFWPNPIDDDFNSDIGARAGLSALGYSMECEDVVLVREFQRHYEPELFKKDLQGQVSKNTRALISCLLREKRA